MNKYPSIIQTTSYNFTGTKNTGELCAGVVKAQAIYPKNPAQHYADLNLLSVAPELQPSFLNPQTNKPKLIECARVDGASDEGPSHDEVMFWWPHLECGKLVTLLTSRCSGSSFLNRVELQNGCLSLGHSNLFIPSTLNGACIDQQTGKVDREKLRANMESAMDVYIDRVNGSPCGDTVIHLFKGADSTQYQDCRQDLQIFLKGSKVKKEHMQKEKPAVYSYFQKVWNVRQRHMVPGLPAQYIFLLVCCFVEGCPHPLCQNQQPTQMSWFPGGPSVRWIPTPVPDAKRPWGNTCCNSCSGFCSGHFLCPEDALKSSYPPMTQPPSHLLKEFFLSHPEPTEELFTSIARKTLLPIDEVKMWLNHLKTVEINRRRGAAKAAETRRRKRQQQQAQEQVRQIQQRHGM